LPASADWRTPLDIVERARHVLGGVIDLDPASDAEAQKAVRATRYLTKEDDAFAGLWPFMTGRRSVFMNPPGCGGKREPRGQTPGRFWSKLMKYREQRALGHAIVIGFNIEDLSRTQAYHAEPMVHFPFCIPRERLRFIDARTGLPGKSPSHANVIVYVPGTIDRREVFAETFGPLGAVRL